MLSEQCLKEFSDEFLKISRENLIETYKGEKDPDIRKGIKKMQPVQNIKEHLQIIEKYIFAEDGDYTASYVLGVLSQMVEGFDDVGFDPSS